MKPDKFPLKGKTTVSVIPAMAFGVIIAGVITGYTTRQVVYKEITNTTLPGYRSPVLNTLTGMMNNVRCLYV